MLAAWFNTVEFYVIAGTVAAAIVALAAVPRRQGAGVLHLVAGELSDSGLPDGETESPGIDMYVDDNRRLIITRRGLSRIADDGAASLAINAFGRELVIEERLTPGRRGTCRRDMATFILDFLGPERYHIRYNSEASGLFTAFTLPVREGIRLSRPLR